MTKAEIREGALSTLSPEERIELAMDLWDSLKPDDVPVPQWHLDIIRERLAEDERDPDSAIPAEQVLDRLRRPRE
jgi:putative addiction module component (TIGR02574 family)